MSALGIVSTAEGAPSSNTSNMTKIEKFNKRMDDLFYATPGCWYGGMPRIEKNGSVVTRGTMALDPTKAAIGIAVIGQSFLLEGEIRIGTKECSGVHAMLIGFYLKAEDEAKARTLAAKLVRAPIALSTGAIVIHSRMDNGATSAEKCNGEPMTEAEWQEYCNILSPA